jgi:hypothetical protein
MRGIELSRAFYEEYGKPMLENEFSEYLDRIAVGLVGHGSECFGFDDEISTDHDFEPGFCIWLTDDDEQKIGFKLFRAYSKLPKEYMGIKCLEKSALGSKEKGVHTVSEFYYAYTGRRGAPECWQDWLYTPSHYFAEATNGEVFHDPLGEFSRIRDIIKNGMPEDVRLKKIASCALKAAQSGQYNYKRCISHGEFGAARLALDEFVRNCAEIVFLLEKRHAPYYKWVFRAMRDLPRLSSLSERLEKLITLPSDETLIAELEIEAISAEIIAEFKDQNITEATCNYLESHAYSINDMIGNNEIRNLHILL